MAITRSLWIIVYDYLGPLSKEIDVHLRGHTANKGYS